MPRFTTAIFAGIAVLIALAAGAAPLPTEEALKERILGDPKAPVTIIEYSSLTCPHCQSFHADTLPEIKKNYIDTGKVRLVMRDFPFDQVSLRAAMMARCARPSMYFKFIEVLFKQQKQWSESNDPSAALARIGKLGGMSQADFDACMKNNDLIDGILKVRLEAQQKFQVDSTPTFIIDDDNKIVGAHPYEVFDKVLKKKVQ
ncbi:MAG: DsbA family protein [Alphaproteobacteria bacterium]|nr:DsbA family protein [Alphaproteobacteria bacterium]